MLIIRFRGLILFIFIYYFFYSCSNDVEKDVIFVDSFPEEKHVETNNLKWIKPYMPIDLLQIDSFLIVLNYQGKFVYQIYNTNKKLLIKECGKFGRGPEEVMMPRFTEQVIKDEKGRFFYVYCGVRKLIYTIDLDKLIRGNDYVIEQNRLTTRLHIQTHLIKVDSLIIGSSDGTKGKIFAYNLFNKNINLWNYYPKIPKINSFDETQLYVLYARLWVYNKEQNLLAGAFNTTFNQLDFYTPEGEKRKTIKFPTTDYKIKSSRFTEESPSYASGITSSNGNIYISYSPDVCKNKVEYKLGSTINIFDWNGEPQKQYFIKNTMIWMPVIDEINRKIYAYAPENIEFPIVELDL